MKLELSVELINAIVDFLSKQPYVQVYGLINEIQLQCNQKKLQLVENENKGE